MKQVGVFLSIDKYQIESNELQRHATVLELLMFVKFHKFPFTKHNAVEEWWRTCTHNLLIQDN